MPCSYSPSALEEAGLLDTDRRSSQAALGQRPGAAGHALGTHRTKGRCGQAAEGGTGSAANKQ